MDLKCPVCGSRRFFVEADTRTVFFSLDSSGKPFDISLPGALLTLQEVSVLHCSGCAWSGTWGGLEGVK